MLAERLAGFVHAYTCYWSVRPFGVSVLIASVDKVPLNLRMLVYLVIYDSRSVPKTSIFSPRGTSPEHST